MPVEKRTVFSLTGRGEQGLVTEEMAKAIGCQSGPIKLLNGVEGRAGGFGLRHIESHTGRVPQINDIGFRDVLSYVRFIATSFEMIALQEDGRLVFLVEKDRLFHHLICQWDSELRIWSVTTAIPKRRNKENMNVVWQKK